MENSIESASEVLTSPVIDENQVKQETNKPLRNEKGWLLPGQTANPNGRPKGQTMKEFARQFLQSLTPEDKLKFLNGLEPQIVWRMAEGNPHQESDINHGFKPTPIIDVSANDGDKKDTPA